MGKILIVDDEPRVLERLKKALEKSNHGVECSSDGKSCLLAVDKYVPDLVILDSGMPKADGIEVLELLKKTQPDLPVILFSGFAEEGAVQAVKDENPAEDNLGSFEINDLIGRIDRRLAPGGAAGKKPFADSRIALIMKRIWASVRDFGLKVIRFLLVRRKAFSAVVGSFIIFFLLRYAFSEKIGIYEIPFDNTSSLCYYKDKIWATDWSTQTIYRLSLQGKELRIEKTYFFSNNHFYALVNTGDNIITADNWTKQFLKHNLDENLSIVFSTRNLQGLSSSIAWHKNGLWSVNPAEGKLYNYNPNNWYFKRIQLNDKIAFIFNDENNLWSVDADNYIARYDASTEAVIETKYQFPILKIRIGKLTGITSDGNNIWAAFENTSRIVRIPVKKLIKVY